MCANESLRFPIALLALLLIATILQGCDVWYVSGVRVKLVEVPKSERFEARGDSERLSVDYEAVFRIVREVAMKWHMEPMSCSGAAFRCESFGKSFILTAIVQHEGDGVVLIRHVEPGVGSSNAGTQLLNELAEKLRHSYGQNAIEFLDAGSPFEVFQPK